MEIQYNFGNYSQKEAYKKIDSFLDKLVEEHSDLVYNPQKKWNKDKDRMDFSFEAKGFYLSGNIKLEESWLILEGKLPWVAKLYSGKIEEMINDNLDNLFKKK